MNSLEPSEFYLSQNYPNPFSKKTTIKFCVAYKNNVKLEVFGSEGKLIKILLDEEKKPGTYEVEYNTCGLCEGVYICQLQVGDYLATRKMNIRG